MWPLRQQSPTTERALLYPQVESNLRRMMQFFSRARENGVVVVRDGLQLVSSGIDFSPFNSAMLAEPMHAMHYREFEARVMAAAEFFRERRERWSFWMCDDALPELIRRRAKNLLISLHMRRTTEPPGMVAESIAPPTRPLPGNLLAVRVADARTRADFSGLTACNFDLPFSICREIYQAEDSWTGGPLTGWVGYVGHEPVATCAVVVTGDVAGIYTVATLPEYRKCGYSESLMRHALREIERETGITRSVLQATTAGYPMYHKMGYRKVCQFSIFLSEH